MNLSKLIEAAKAKVASMSPQEVTDMLRRQGASLAANYKPGSRQARLFVRVTESKPRFVARFERTGSIGYWSVYRKSDGMTFGVGGTLEAAMKCATQHPYSSATITGRIINAR